VLPIPELEPRITIMPRPNRARKTLKRILEWQLNSDITDAQLGAALGMPPATFSRRKDAEGFPTFEELERIGRALHVNPRWLQVEFGYLGKDELTEPPDPVMSAKRHPKLTPRRDAPLV
jgi:hypothetical protein